MAFLPIRKVPVEQQRKVKLMRYVTSALSIMTVFLLEMFQRTGLKGYHCSEWRLRKVTRTQKKSYSEPRARVSSAKVGCLARRGWQVKRVSA